METEKKPRYKSIDKAIKKYKQKCKQKNVIFYPNEKDESLYQFCLTFNFQGEVKKFLWRKYKKAMRDEKKKSE